MKHRIVPIGKLVIWMLLASISGNQIYAQDLSFEVNAPNSVRVGQQFKLVYTFNENASITQPDFGDFVYLGGPSRGQSSYTSIVNGKVTSENNFTFTYYLQAPGEKGSYTIPGAKATFKKKTYTSDAVSIEVVEGVQSAPRTVNSPSQPEGSSTDELFLELELDKRVVYKNEPVTARLVLYSTPNLQLSDLEYSSTPEFPGFFKEELDQPEGISSQNTKVGNKVYTVYTLQEVVLFPQKSGDIYIDPIQIRVSALQRVSDPFWGYNYQRVPVSRTSKKTKLTVKELPENPSASSSGGVGSFTLKSSLDPREIKVNDAVTYKLELTGKGNIKFINDINGKFPEAFEIIGPHREVSLNRDKKSGKLAFEYTAIAREPGIYNIEPFAFTYFDTQEKKFRTLRTDAYSVRVLEGDGTGEIIASSVSEAGVSIKKMGKDISYIEMESRLKPKDSFYFGRLWFYQTYLGSALLFLLVLVIRREQIRRSADAVRNRKRKAGRVVSKRLRKARKLLKNNNIEAYYNELERALWGYLADKMNMQISDLSVENVKAKMNRHEVEESLSEDFMEIIQHCQFARYSPGGMEAEMEGLFEKARILINKLDQKL
ncbi:MAG: protein BatD [Bacteroidales bacterium]|nr:protein BatD [Bacteroidales bacterium]